jgi:hypothetical protein
MQSESVKFRVVGEVTSVKTLSVYGYVANGTIEESDFTDGTFIGSKLLSPVDFLTDNPGDTETPNQDIDFDITDFLAELPSDVEWIGFNLRETESDGSIVTLEYLVLGTFLSLAFAVGVTGSANANGGLIDPLTIVVNPSSTNVMNNGMTETRGVVEFQVQPVPEPASALVWLTGGGIAMAVRRRRAARSAC